MARAYAELIMKGLKTIDDVPARIRDEVQRILDEAGYGLLAGSSKQNANAESIYALLDE